MYFKAIDNHNTTTIYYLRFKKFLETLTLSQESAGSFFRTQSAAISEVPVRITSGKGSAKELKLFGPRLPFGLSSSRDATPWDMAVDP